MLYHILIFSSFSGTVHTSSVGMIGGSLAGIVVVLSLISYLVAKKVQRKQTRICMRSQEYENKPHDKRLYSMDGRSYLHWL